MRSFVVFLMMALSSAALAVPVVDKAAPTFRLPAADGGEVSLEDFRGKTVVLEWTNHQCPFVKKHYGGGNMQRMQKKFADEGVVWLSIISSKEGKQGHVSPAKALALSAERGAVPAHVLIDEPGDVGRAYAAKTTPHMYVIDKDGVLRYMGGIDSIPSGNPADIPKAVSYIDVVVPEVLAGKTELSYTVTRPYGCSVKY